MKAVLDTGVFISALINGAGYPYRSIELWTDKRFELITSEWQLSELRAVSRYPHLTERISAHRAGALINRLRNKAAVLTDLPRIELSPDPDDNPLLAIAVEGQAQYLVSNDKAHVLSLGEVKGIPVVTVRAFVELLE